MAFIPVPDVAEAAMVYILSGQECINTLYFEKVGGWDTADLTALGENLRDWWDTYMQANVTSSCSLTEIRLRDLSGEAAPGITFVTGLPLVGSHPSPAMPNNVTLAVSFHTALRGRSFRGRNYVVGLTEGQIAGNTVGTTDIAAFKAAYEALLDPVTMPDGEWVVVSRFHLGAPRDPGIGTPIISVSVDPTVDSQRRRLP